MSYSILRTDKADEDINAIINYIAEDSQSIDTALKYLDKLENAIMQLADFSDIGCIPRYRTLKLQKYRVLIVEKHLVFYKIFHEKNEIIIYRVIDGRQDYKNLI